MEAEEVWDGGGGQDVMEVEKEGKMEEVKTEVEAEEEVKEVVEKIIHVWWWCRTDAVDQNIVSLKLYKLSLA